MADPPAPTSVVAAPVESTPEPSNPWDLVLKVFGAIGTGLGLLGFVTLFGGAILWVRAEEAGLPANEAISVVPNGVLVTTGASFLVPALLVALGVVVLISVVHLGFRGALLIQARDSDRGLEVLRYQADSASREAEEEMRVAEAAQALKQSVSGEQARLALRAVSTAAQLRRDFGDQLAFKQVKLERGLIQWLVELGVGFVLLALVPLVNGAILHLDFFWDGLILVLFVAGTLIICLTTYFVTEKFVWFGVVTFVAVGVYIGAATYLSTIGNPKVEPAAALRGDLSPVVGVFVADTTSNVYIGTFEEGGVEPRLLVVPRSQVTDLAIGPLLDPGEAQKRSIAMAIEACEQKIQMPASEVAPAAEKEACTKPQVEALGQPGYNGAAEGAEG
ncbi:MAG TPA: hypothetical protein VLL27_10360 [Solirubrobacterales bacterium]|nr:hypothetical protein [Solirubrobacterales bacterium]